ncbi:SDR family oxidoreductase [Leucobacter denitrificans]|uniref:SDR family oxidoreductase n=1 Tax=Leucobacter denitrificans TaxID=683042 RepID=A0A7G9S6A7_9MICO|nr:SDR family oxidoreductase [Leucobacter denitrificans]QNN63382.1 SDR family oxidoreductase [Leucobacter denitrificans]
MDFNRTLPRRVVVTGAQSGIGRAVSEAVIASGGKVFGIDRTEGAWEAAGFTARTADITDAGSVTQVFEEVESILGGSPDAVVHCAGIYRHSAIESTSLDEWNLSMTVNSTGSFLVSQAASRVMESGAIVLLTSVAYARGDRLEPCLELSGVAGFGKSSADLHDRPAGRCGHAHERGREWTVQRPALREPCRRDH